MNMIEKTLQSVVKNPKYILRLIIEGILIGIFAGIVVSFYRFILTSAESTLYNILSYINGNIYLTCLWLGILIILGLFVSQLVKWEPLSSGSGIPQITAEVKGYLDASWWKNILVKVVGGSISTLAGLSLGREGPSVQLGGMAAKGVSKIFKNTKTDEHKFIMTGSGAGLACTFNAPLAGVIFTLEEINHTFDKTIIFIGLIAAIIADFISKIIFGQSTIFNFPNITLSLNYYWLYIVLGLFIGVCGLLYNIGMIKANDFWAKYNVPLEVKITLAFFITGIVSLIIPQILAGGHSMIQILEFSIPPLSILIVLLISKYLLSVLSFSSGTPGGIFFPLLVLGAYIGGIFGAIVIPIFHLDPMIAYKFIIISMAGMFASTVRAPITGIVLITEMTGSSTSLIALIIVSVVAYIIPTIMGNKPIYESLLERILKNNKNDINSYQSKHSLSEYIIPLKSSFNGKRIKDINLPENTLIVSISRDGENIIAQDDFKLNFGDELFILMDSSTYSEDNKIIEQLIYDEK